VQVAADLTADPGPWLARTLLAVNADRLVALVPADHSDLTGSDSVAALGALVAPKWRLRRRRLPREQLALVEATAVDAGELDDGGRLVRWLLDRSHGKIGNVWTEGLSRAPAPGGGPRTKKQARAMVEAAAPDPGMLAAAMMDLPRHQIARITRSAARSARVSGP
jgi:hypothetical protein